MNGISPTRRILLVMNQPPGCSGVQALIYNKILPYLEDNGWEFHFAGPHPEMVSVLREDLAYPSERLHYTRNVSLSLYFSILRHRRSRQDVLFYFFGVLQLLARWAEQLLRHDSRAYLCRGLRRTILEADQRWNFDLIAGKSPAFHVLEEVARVTEDLQKPFLAMLDDPYGDRDVDGFKPHQPRLQRKLLDSSCGVIFMSPLTQHRYIEAGLVAAEKTYSMTDSFPCASGAGDQRREQDGSIKELVSSVNSLRQPLRIVHLGMLPQWRPVESLLAALKAIHHDPCNGCDFRLDIYGYLYPEAAARVSSDASLRSLIRIHPMVSYHQSHALADQCDLQLVVIGPRHVDNIPSKFFEYLGHCKPVFVLGPLGNPISSIVEDLGIGIYVDVMNSAAIVEGLSRINRDYCRYQQAFVTSAEAISAYSAPRVARLLCDRLDAMMAGAASPHLRR